MDEDEGQNSSTVQIPSSWARNLANVALLPAWIGECPHGPPGCVYSCQVNQVPCVKWVAHPAKHYPVGMCPRKPDGFQAEIGHTNSCGGISSARDRVSGCLSDEFGRRAQIEAQSGLKTKWMSIDVLHPHDQRLTALETRGFHFPLHPILALRGEIYSPK